MQKVGHKTKSDKPKSTQFWTDWLHANEILKLEQEIKTLDTKGYDEMLTRISSSPQSSSQDHKKRTSFESVWLHEVMTVGSKGASLYRVLIKTLLWDVIIQILSGFCFRITSAIILLEATRSLFIRLKELEENELAHKIRLIFDLSLESELLSHVFVISLFLIVYTCSLTCLTVGGGRIGLKCRLGLTELIQRKSIRLHLFSKSPQSKTRAMKLITNEVAFIEEDCRTISFILIGPVGISVCLIWLATRVTGWHASVSSLPLMVAILLIKFYSMRTSKLTNTKLREVTSKRIEATDTFLSAIKVIKMYAWENPFKKRIQAFRNSELDLAAKLDLLTVVDLIVFVFSSRLLSTLTFLVAINHGGEFDVLSLFLVPLSYNLFAFDYLLQFTRGIQNFEELLASCKNIQSYLLLEEKEDMRQRRNFSDKFKSAEQVIICFNLSVSSDLTMVPETRCIQNKQKMERPKSKNSTIIDNITALLGPDELVMVIGKVGSGKSTFLLSLLGETNVTAGLIHLGENSKIAYASQEPLVLMDSFKNNILVGRPFQAERYKTVIDICALNYDLERFKDGDKTMIGPKGVSLSGGQKARLNLARTIYTEADIYLLDDPLSAIDARIAEHIFNRCIREFLKNKLVLLATHQLRFLDRCDKIVFFEPGKLPIVGSSSSVMEREELKQLTSCTSSSRLINPQCKDTSLVEFVSNTYLDMDAEQELPALCNEVSKKQEKSSTYIYFLKLGFNSLGLSLLILNSILNAPALAALQYYSGIWSKKAWNDLNDPHIDEAVYLKHLFQSWLTHTAITMVGLAHTVVFVLHFAKGVRRASGELHNRFINSIFKAKMSFYDQCSAGDLTSRYAASFSQVDHMLFYSAIYFLSYSLWSIGEYVTLGIFNLYSMIHFICLYLIISYMLKMLSKRLKKLSSLSESLLAPTLASFAEMTDDLSTIRSNESYLIYCEDKFNKAQSQFISMKQLKLSFEKLIFMVAKLATGLGYFLFLVVVLSVYRKEMDLSILNSLLTLSIIVATIIPLIDDFGVMLQTTIVAVDKVRQYTVLEPEDVLCETRRDTEEEPKCTWKQYKWKEGRIVFDRVSLRYSEGEKLALDNISFTVAGGEHIGVVGRTGAGKSSIVSALFRLYDNQGVIRIDDADTRSMDLAKLRASIGVIPQDPVLYSDTLRNNLDPFGRYTDEQVWYSLEAVGLRKHVANDLVGGLGYQISERGHNFSVGQRQLVCLARAILKGSKVLLIDEATANVDPDTDALIQRTIRSHFKHVTVMTIAHRLDTVMDYDKILVLDDGRIVGFDTVEQLKETNSLFSSMLKASASSNLSDLKPLA